MTTVLGQLGEGVVAVQGRLDSLESVLAHEFDDENLLRLALSHRSWCSERPGTPSNERLEFLGDAVLGLAVAEHVYLENPDLPEGKLAKIRSAVVNARVLAEVAQDLRLGEEVLLGRGEEASGGRAKVSILADTLEAVIGAVYLDAGWEPAKKLVLRLLDERIKVAVEEPEVFDHKSRLQEMTVGRGLGLPTYTVEGEGPDHARSYRARVVVDGIEKGRGSGTSKKEAEQEAALVAWQELSRA